MEGEVPRGEPGVLPRVGHGEHVLGVQVNPAAQHGVLSVCLGRRYEVALEPPVGDEVVQLLAPQHARERLPLDAVEVRLDVAAALPPVGAHGVVELVRLAASRAEDLLEGVAEGSVQVGVGEPEIHRAALTRGEGEHVVRGGLRPDVIRIDGRRAPPRDDVIVDAVLDVPGAVLAVEKAPGVGLVLREEHLPTPLAVQSSPGQEDGVTAGEGVPDPHLGRGDAGVVRIVRGDERQGRARRCTRQEGPGVAEPERRQQVQRPGLGASVAHGDAHEDVLGGRLGVLDEDVEVPVVVQGPVSSSSYSIGSMDRARSTSSPYGYR